MERNEVANHNINITRREIKLKILNKGVSVSDEQLERIRETPGNPT